MAWTGAKLFALFDVTEDLSDSVNWLHHCDVRCLVRLAHFIRTPILKAKLWGFMGISDGKGGQLHQNSTFHVEQGIKRPHAFIEPFKELGISQPNLIQPDEWLCMVMLL